MCSSRLWNQIQRGLPTQWSPDWHVEERQQVTISRIQELAGNSVLLTRFAKMVQELNGRDGTAICFPGPGTSMEEWGRLMRVVHAKGLPPICIADLGYAVFVSNVPASFLAVVEASLRPLMFTACQPHERKSIALIWTLVAEKMVGVEALREVMQAAAAFQEEEVEQSEEGCWGASTDVGVFALKAMSMLVLERKWLMIVWEVSRIVSRELVWKGGYCGLHSSTDRCNRVVKFCGCGVKVSGDSDLESESDYEDE